MAVVTSSSKAPWRVLSVSFFASIYVFASATFAQDVVDDLTGFGPVIPSEAPVALYEPRRIAWPLEMPWGVAFLPDGRILITERAGRLRVIENGSLMTQAINGVPDVVSGGHSGLLDVLIDRDFEQNHRIFLSYTHGVSGAISMRVASAVLEGDAIADVRVIFDSRPAIGGVDEIGGRLAYGPDNLLYLTIGDRAEKARAQDLMDHSGTIVRFREDGSIPDDNPFVGRDDALPEIYSYGHRNPQGLMVSRSDGKLWSVEHGPYGGDELNVIEKGANYGWPLVTFGIEYDGSIISERTSAPGLADPVHKWVPSIAPSSLASYEGDIMPSEWTGNFLVGALAGEQLARLVLENGLVTSEQRLLHHVIGRIRNVSVGPDGYIYLLTDGHEAGLYRLEPLSEDVAAGRRPE